MKKNKNAHFLSAEKAVKNNDYESAVKEYSLAAEMGNIDAQISLAILYATGTGVDCDGLKAKELLEAVLTDEKSNIKQAALASNNLATLYLTGAKNIARDSKNPRNTKKWQSCVDFHSRYSSEIEFLQNLPNYQISSLPYEQHKLLGTCRCMDSTL